MFRVPVLQILQKIRNEPYFTWPHKIGRELTRRNQSVYCQHHHDKGHTTEECKTLWSYLNYLLKEGKLKKFTNDTLAQRGAPHQGYQGGPTPRPPLETIHVILTEPKHASATSTRVMSVSPLLPISAKKTSIRGPRWNLVWSWVFSMKTWSALPDPMLTLWLSQCILGALMCIG